jgi:hypothetical protein
MIMNKLKTAAIIVALFVSAIISYNLLNESQDLTTIELLNIEALAQGEVVSSQIPCHSSAKRNYSRAYVDCASCTRIDGWEGVGVTASCYTH